MRFRGFFRNQFLYDMTKVIITVILGMVFFFGAIVAWCSGYNIVAVLLLFATLFLSCFFEQGRKEINEDDFLE